MWQVRITSRYCQQSRSIGIPCQLRCRVEQCFLLKVFRKSYLQLELNQQAQVLLTINNHLGLFRFRRLPCDVACAPAISQAVMEQILRNLLGTACYIADVIIADENYEHCYGSVEQVLRRLSELGVKVNADIGSFFQQCVTYLGHETGTHGLRPSVEKVEAIRKTPRPAN